MTDATTDEEIEEPKSSKLPLIIGIVLALLGGGGGFFLTSSGIILGGESQPAEAKEEEKAEGEKAPRIAFVPLDPLTISLNGDGSGRHLRFRAELEVDRAYVSDVELIRPRIIDLLNGYLRAVELQDLENPAVLTRLRAQMLRRVQVVAGRDQVKDLLIMEFVVN